MLDPDIETVAGTPAAETPEAPNAASNPPESDDSAARPRRRSAGRPAGPPVATGLMFQAPDTTPLPPLPREEQAQSTDGDDPDRDSVGEGGQAAQRRKRSRGGRRRRKSDDDTAESTTDDDLDGDDTDDDANDGADGAENGGTRRRRKRARAGEGAAAAPDDPDHVVVKVREGRTAEDEITGVT
ncbi:MAG TPA: ribonuclease E/G, partial [Aeromicrobium sp.]|nr:ribonuclease E/G [Aeromicrobium sp.]